MNQRRQIQEKELAASAPNSDGILLVGHGTRDEVGQRQFFELSQRLSERVAPVPVQPALLEFAKPTIPEGWQSLVALGVTHVHVAPLLLFAAGHAKQDVPSIVAQCQSQDPQVTFTQARPISRHRSIIELATQRIKTGLSQLRSPPHRTAVVLVGRGSEDPCAQADMRVLSEVIGRRLDVATHCPAFYAMAEPRLREVLAQVAESRRFDGIVVYPHLLFEGRLYQAIAGQTGEVSAEHPAVEFQTVSYLGPHQLVADAIADRLDQR